MNISYRSAKVSDYEGIYYVSCYSWEETYRGFMPDEYLDDRINNFEERSLRTKKYLEHLEFEGEIGNNISFANCTNLTRNSLMSIINHLQVKTSGEFTLTLSADSIEKLTVAEMDIASDKGWNIPNA